jgi:hypothetical protein
MKTSRLDILHFDRRKDSRYFCQSREQLEGILDYKLMVSSYGIISYFNLKSEIYNLQSPSPDHS